MWSGILHGLYANWAVIFRLDFEMREGAYFKEQ